MFVTAFLAARLSRWRPGRTSAFIAALLVFGAFAIASLTLPLRVFAQERSHPTTVQNNTPRPDIQAERLRRLNNARSWGYQLVGIDIDEAARSPYDLIVVDATMGLNSKRSFTPEDVARLKRKPDGGRRIVVSYISIGEAEDYRADYFAKEYLEEDFPDWLLHENKDWKGNRIVKFCTEGWQRTILGDELGNNVYNFIEKSPLHRIVDLGFDGVYLDRADVYTEVTGHCPNAKQAMVTFVARLAAHARRRNPQFMVILQNAEELLRDKRMLDTIDAIAKEDLFYGADHSQSQNSAASINEAIGNLKLAKAAGRQVFVVDYLVGAANKADAKRRIQEQGFVPYIGSRALDRLWLDGRDF